MCNGLSLAFELGSWTGRELQHIVQPPSHFATTSWPCDPPPREVRVGFHDHVEIAIFPQDDDDDFFKFHLSGMSHKALFQWTSSTGKPWIIPDEYKQNRYNIEDEIITPIKEPSKLAKTSGPVVMSGHSNEGSMPSEPTTVPETDPMRNRGAAQPTRPTQGWLADIWNLLEQDGQATDDEDGPVIYVVSYYIDHFHHRREGAARPLRFGQDVRDWEESVRFTWEDYVDPQAPLDIIIVDPQPPFPVYRGTAATVIVHQHYSVHRAACLITAVLPHDPDFRVLESAHSLERTVSTQRLLLAADVHDLCRQRHEQGYGECSIYIGLHPLPADQDVPVHTGLGLTIRVPPPMTEEEVEHNFEDSIRQQRIGRAGHIWERADEEHPEQDHPLPSDQDGAPCL